MRSRPWIAGLAVFASLCGLCAVSFVHAQEKKIKVGDKAPAFESVDENGKAWKSSDVVGKKILVLYFYPADFTGGCTKQACGYRDDIEKLGGKGVEVIGVSGDTPESHRLFKKEHKLNFTLLADTKGQVAKKFGVPVNKGSTNKTKTDGKEVEIPREVNIARYTVIIDKMGNVAAIDAVKDAAGDPKRIAEVVKGLDSK